LHAKAIIRLGSRGKTCWCQAASFLRSIYVAATYLSYGNSIVTCNVFPCFIEVVTQPVSFSVIKSSHAPKTPLWYKNRIEFIFGMYFFGGNGSLKNISRNRNIMHPIIFPQVAGSNMLIARRSNKRSKGVCHTVFIGSFTAIKGQSHERFIVLTKLRMSLRVSTFSNFGCIMIPINHERHWSPLIAHWLYKMTSRCFLLFLCFELLAYSLLFKHRFYDNLCNNYIYYSKYRY